MRQKPRLIAKEMESPRLNCLPGWENEVYIIADHTDDKAFIHEMVGSLLRNGYQDIRVAGQFRQQWVDAINLANAASGDAQYVYARSFETVEELANAVRASVQCRSLMAYNVYLISDDNNLTEYVLSIAEPVNQIMMLRKVG